MFPQLAGTPIEFRWCGHAGSNAPPRLVVFQPSLILGESWGGSSDAR